MLLSGDDLCICSTTDATTITVSHECRARQRQGSSCRVPLTASTGTNMASGTLDEFFVYTANAYTSGGVCTVGAAHRDTLLAVYGACGRVGAQQPLGFSNSEIHSVRLKERLSTNHHLGFTWPNRA